MKKPIYFLVVGIAVLGAILLPGASRAASQTISGTVPEGLPDLLDQTLRVSDPPRVVKAIDQASAPYRARPADSTDAIPPEVTAALADLLDFEGPENTNIEFDLSAGQKLYPAMNALILMRRPVLPALTTVLENEDPASVKSQNALTAIRRILSRNNIAAVDYLRARSAISRTEKGKANLLHAAANIVAEQPAAGQ